ncbi:hypothetical protein ACP4OV_018410 [Aristida adscensionis]
MLLPIPQLQRTTETLAPRRRVSLAAGAAAAPGIFLLAPLAHR